MTDFTNNEADAMKADWGSTDTNEQADTDSDTTGWGVMEDNQSDIANPDLVEVRDVILEEFNHQTWLVTEAALSVCSTLLISGIQNCSGIVVVGPSGCGKTTALQFFEDATHEGTDLVYRSDDMTPASFVSHDASREEDELRKSDLLVLSQSGLEFTSESLDGEITVDGWFD